MAFLFRRDARRRREQRIVQRRTTLDSISDAQLRDYRLSRELILNLIRGYEQSEWANHTKRSNEVTPETEVSHDQNLISKSFKNIFCLEVSSASLTVVYLNLIVPINLRTSVFKRGNSSIIFEMTCFLMDV